MKELLKFYIKSSFKSLFITFIINIFVMFIIFSKITSLDDKMANYFINILIPMISMVMCFLCINNLYEVAYIETKEGISEIVASAPINYKKLILFRAFVMGFISWVSVLIVNLAFFMKYVSIKSYFVWFVLFLLPFFSAGYSIIVILLINPFIKYDIRVKNTVFTMISFGLVYLMSMIVKMIIKYQLSVIYFYFINSAFVIIFFLSSMVGLKFYKKSLFLRG